MQAEDWEQLVQLGVAESPTGYARAEKQRFFISKLLEIGPICLDTLYSVLSQHGTPTRPADLAIASIADVISAAVDFLCARNRGMGTSYAYWMLCTSYYNEWHKWHGALGLADIPGLGLVIVRGGPIMGALRQANPVEKLLWSPTTSPGSAQLSQFAQCVGLVLDSLGCVVLEAVAALLSAGGLNAWYWRHCVVA